MIREIKYRCCYCGNEWFALPMWVRQCRRCGASAYPVITAYNEEIRRIRRNRRIEVG